MKGKKKKEKVEQNNSVFLVHFCSFAFWFVDQYVNAAGPPEKGKNVINMNTTEFI